MTLQTNESTTLNHSQGLFIMKGANEWLEIASKMQKPKKLFGNFWKKGELAILFSGTGLGKSILSVQIADSISRGVPILAQELETEKQPVLYFDLEVSEMQFKERNSNKNGEAYYFDRNFKRVVFNREHEDTDDFSYYKSIIQNMESIIVSSNAKIAIIDNLTYFNGDVEKAKDASQFIKDIQFISKKHGVSILCVSHTPKRDETRPIDVNDLSGSKMISNLVDSIFTIGASRKEKSMRYIKHIKSRSSEIIHDSENVIVCNIIKDDSKLEFNLLGLGFEQEHLKEIDKQERLLEVKRLKSQGKTNVEIGQQFGVTEGAIRAWLKE
jgi:RecA-family ATPase